MRQWCGKCIYKWSVYTYLFQIGKHGFQHSKINNECIHICSVSSRWHTLYISSWAWQTTACHIKSRRLACFRNNVHKMSKPKCGFIRLLLRTNAAITVRDEGPPFPFLFFFFHQTQSLCNHYYLGDLALNQGQRRSAFWLLITTVMLTYF